MFEGYADNRAVFSGLAGTQPFHPALFLSAPMGLVEIADSAGGAISKFALLFRAVIGYWSPDRDARRSMEGQREACE